MLLFNLFKKKNKIKSILINNSVKKIDEEINDKKNNDKKNNDNKNNEIIKNIVNQELKKLDLKTEIK